MLQVSERAAAILHETLDENTDDAANVLRLAMTEEGLALAIGAREDGDQVVEHAERAVLAIPRDLSGLLDGASIDAVETPEGTRLVFDAPQLHEDDDDADLVGDDSR
ncbi:MAG TPA: hypothetical protein VNM91_00050 [Dehalococcoidia bacterium]|nr:hypothetical protein [Dehalococcoidia bacterium]